MTSSSALGRFTCPFQISLVIMSGRVEFLSREDELLQCFCCYDHSKYETGANLNTISLTLLTHKAPPIICSRRQFQILLLFQNNKEGIVFHENHLLGDDSHELSYLIFFRKIRKDVAKFVVCCSCDSRVKTDGEFSIMLALHS